MYSFFTGQLFTGFHYNYIIISNVLFLSKSTYHLYFYYPSCLCKCWNDARDILTPPINFFPLEANTSIDPLLIIVSFIFVCNYSSISYIYLARYSI